MTDDSGRRVAKGAGANDAQWGMAAGWQLEHVAPAPARTDSIGHGGYPRFTFHGKHTARSIFRRVEQLPNVVGPGT